MPRAQSQRLRIDVNYHDATCLVFARHNVSGFPLMGGGTGKDHFVANLEKIERVPRVN